MTGIVPMPATIWKFQIVRFFGTQDGNDLETPTRPNNTENAKNTRMSAGIANQAILDRFVDASKTIGVFDQTTGGISYAISR
ncbi:hypothetical protein [Methanoregula sp.]|jgi:hypothetical protein|uniref:hypothetical protein n=1 Tax=Methanoregula sp. TaxID=2052170 RepID=UPI003565C58E